MIHYLNSKIAYIQIKYKIKHFINYYIHVQKLADRKLFIFRFFHLVPFTRTYPFTSLNSIFCTSSNKYTLLVNK